MTSVRIPPNDQALIESIVNLLPPKAQEDARSLFQGWAGQIAKLNISTGNVPGQSTGNVPTPPQAAVTAKGANATIVVTIVPPSLNPPATLWHEVSYSPVKGFTSQVTTMEPTTSTSVVIGQPGLNVFIRVRSSYNKIAWNSYSLAGESSVSAGLVSSDATNEAGAFNQTNLAVVTSVAIGASAAVQVQGAGGPLTSMVRIKGSRQVVRPGATIVGVTPGSTRYVGWDGQKYRVRSTLAALLEDGVEPVGKLSVVNTGTPTLPTIVPIISGGHVIGFNVTNGGAGAVGPYTLNFATFGLGTGATFGAQTIVAGVLISVAPGNPGDNYSGGTTVVASGGGVFPGSDGGGTAEGNTNGRLTTL